MIGIYKITNNITNKAYIGQSTNITKRWQRHQKDCYDCNSSSYDYPLYRSIRKYGLDNFTFEVLEICSEDMLDEREIYWISYFNTYIDGYNQTLGGQNTTYQKITPVSLQQITDYLQTNPFITHKELADRFGVSVEMIQGINTGRYWHRDLTYPLQDSSINKRTQQPKQIWICQECGVPVSKGNHLCHVCAAKRTRIVERPSKEQLLQEIATSSFEAVGRKYGVSGKAISKWCKAYGLPYLKKDIVKLYQSQR